MVYLRFIINQSFAIELEKLRKTKRCSISSLTHKLIIPSKRNKLKFEIFSVISLKI